MSVALMNGESMLVFWKIRYFDRNDKQFKDRDLYLDTSTLDPPLKAAIELAVDTDESRQRSFLKHRSLFKDDAGLEDKLKENNFGRFACAGPEEYFEDETGAEITLTEAVRIQHGNPNLVVFPSGARQHDIDFHLADRKPMSVNVTLSPEDLRLLGYFCRDLRELLNSAFRKDGPGKISSHGSITTGDLVLVTAVSDEEIRSFVTIFRRLYMRDELANFQKAVAVFTRVLGDQRHAKLVAAIYAEHAEKLSRPPDLRPFVQPGKCSFTRKRLLDVFLYTQYAHQPDERRQRQYIECLGELDGRQPLLAWMFLSEIWKCSLEIGNAGRIIAYWFDAYCQHHKITPEVLNSLLHENPGVGSQEKRADQKTRLLREKTEELAQELWKRAGEPAGGAAQFVPEAAEQLRKALEG